MTHKFIIREVGEDEFTIEHKDGPMVMWKEANFISAGDAYAQIRPYCTENTILNYSVKLIKESILCPNCGKEQQCVR